MRQSKTLTDRSGAAHEWTVTEFPAEEGFTLLLELLEASGEAAAVGASALVRALLSGDPKAALATLSGGELAGLAAALSRFAAKLAQKGGWQLVLRLLKYTNRDGRPIFVPGRDDVGKVPGCNPQIEFAGNYRELIAGLVFVVEVNFGPFGATSPDVPT